MIANRFPWRSFWQPSPRANGSTPAQFAETLTAAGLTVVTTTDWRRATSTGSSPNEVAAGSDEMVALSQAAWEGGLLLAGRDPGNVS